ncbi:MAG: hypothetical protein DRR08_11165 [Candidatus Parabeggiatoa sp. nov. 2]|nr:MAG: hypothetical protein B6247_07215 [Beggiatoa sp. 4572_84]RKZ60490.1 MAG: hypothetical protein DRR08_11165 [Gammaproteobacteria bacterium]
MKQQLFRLLTEFETWQDGQALSEVRLVLHDLVLAHLARLYGGLAWNAQHFGLCPSYPLVVDIQQDRPVALTELLAVTATGKFWCVPKPRYLSVRIRLKTMAYSLSLGPFGCLRHCERRCRIFHCIKFN